jgi:CubicO group peptidase (beta-lactamase class C family)
LLAVLSGALQLAACGGGGGDSTPPTTSPPSTGVWSAVDAALDSSAAQFPNGLTVEIATPLGVVYSRQVGAFSNDTFGEIASASKWVSGTVMLRLVDQGILSLDTRTKDVLVDANGQAWSGNLGEATLRDLLSMQSGINGDLNAADSAATLKDAVDVIYTTLGPTSKPPGAIFAYGSTHWRIAARMAEVRTGKNWNQIFAEQLQTPLNWSAGTVFSQNGTLANPNPAGGLATSGREYMRFLMLQLRKGLDGSTRLLSSSLIDEQRSEQWRVSTQIFFSPYAALGKSYHYGLGNWRECDTPSDVARCDAALRVSSTGGKGFAPWIDVQAGYAGLIMTRQNSGGTAGIQASEDLKAKLAPLIPAALAQNPPVIRPVP